jgi:hypothetical protein
LKRGSRQNINEIAVHLQMPAEIIHRHESNETVAVDKFENEKPPGSRVVELRKEQLRPLASSPWPRLSCA